MKTYHVLNGDALREQFPSNLEGEIIVFRECLVDGPVSAATEEAFYEQRAEFLVSSYGASSQEYLTQSRGELEKLEGIEVGAEVNFWFEDDLFCQVNFWFALYQTRQRHVSRFLVRPFHLSPFGFAAYDRQGLLEVYSNRTVLPPDGPLFDLWNSYSKSDIKSLSSVASQLQVDFPFIEDAVEAHCQRRPHNGFLGRPSELLMQIQKELNTDQFGPIFGEFSKRAPIYGFGDVQVKRLLEEINN